MGEGRFIQFMTLISPSSHLDSCHGRARLSGEHRRAAGLAPSALAHVCLQRANPNFQLPTPAFPAPATRVPVSSSSATERHRLTSLSLSSFSSLDTHTSCVHVSRTRILSEPHTETMPRPILTRNPPKADDGTSAFCTKTGNLDQGFASPASASREVYSEQPTLSCLTS